jgi:predicted SAM-dependent methyltransferase
MSVKNSMLERVPVGLRRALREVRHEFFSAVRHRRAVKRAKKYFNARALKLNIGCGPNPKSGWVNIDMVGNVDLRLDLREKIPLLSGSVQTVYSEHFFEHLDYPGDAQLFLSECFRILEPRGLFSVAVPDARWPLYDYASQGIGGYFEAAKVHGWHPAWCRTKMEHINYHFRQNGEHRFAWDFETMEQALRETGFVEIKQREYLPDLDSASRAVGTLYVDALKPFAKAAAVSPSRAGPV